MWLGCYCYGDEWVYLLRDYPFLHSWLWLLMLWAAVRWGFRNRAAGPVHAKRYVTLALLCTGLDPALSWPISALFVARMLWTTVVDDPRLWLVSPLYRAFHRALAFCTVLMVPGAYLRYALQEPWSHRVGLDEGLVPWLFGLGVALLAGALALARSRPELLGEVPAAIRERLARNEARGTLRPELREAARRASRLAALRRRIPATPRAVAVALGQRCPLCHDGLAEAALTVCAGCETVAHTDCAREFGGCGTLGCGSLAAGRPGRLTLQPLGKQVLVEATVLA